MKTESRFIHFLRRNGAALLLAAGLVALYYFAAYRLTFVESDYAQHGRWAMGMTNRAMLESFYNGSERLWHIIVRFTFDHLLHDLYRSTAIVTAVMDGVAYFLIFKTFDQALPEKPPRWLLALITLTPFLASALTWPGGALYTTAGGLSTWHNPTNIMVRPFAAAVFYMTLRIYNRRRCGEHGILARSGADFAFQGGFWRQFGEPVYTGAELILYPLCLLLSVYSKPSFLQFFAPAIFIFLMIDVIRTRGMLLPFCLKLALSYLPAACILLMAVKSYFPSGASAVSDAAQTAAETGASAGVAVYFMKSSFSGMGDFLSTLLRELFYLLRPCAFPLLVFLLGRKRGEYRPMTRLAVICLLVAYAETLLLHETGTRAAHGNFLWGMYLASWLAWTAGAGEYVGLAADEDRSGRVALYAGTPVLAWHLVCGIVYLVLILLNGYYLI